MLCPGFCKLVFFFFNQVLNSLSKSFRTSGFVLRVLWLRFFTAANYTMGCIRMEVLSISSFQECLRLSWIVKVICSI